MTTFLRVVVQSFVIFIVINAVTPDGLPFSLAIFDYDNTTIYQFGTSGFVPRNMLLGQEYRLLGSDAALGILYSKDWLTNALYEMNFGDSCMPVGPSFHGTSHPDRILLGCGTTIISFLWDGKTNVTDCDFEEYVTLSADSANMILYTVIDGRGRALVVTGNWVPGTFWNPTDTQLHKLEGKNQTPVPLPPGTVISGIAFNAEGDLLYYVDIGNQAVYGCHYDAETGFLDVQNCDVALQFGDNVRTRPSTDMIVDDKGLAYISIWNDTYYVVADLIGGKFLSFPQIPFISSTGVALVGPKLNMLVLTSANAGLDREVLDEYPLSGALIAIETNSTGVVPNAFKDDQ